MKRILNYVLIVIVVICISSCHKDEFGSNKSKVAKFNITDAKSLLVRKGLQSKALSSTSGFFKITTNNQELPVYAINANGAQLVDTPYIPLSITVLNSDILLFITDYESLPSDNGYYHSYFVDTHTGEAKAAYDDLSISPNGIGDDVIYTDEAGDAYTLMDYRNPDYTGNVQFTKITLSKGISAIKYQVINQITDNYNNNLEITSKYICSNNFVYDQSNGSFIKTEFISFTLINANEGIGVNNVGEIFKYNLSSKSSTKLNTSLWEVPDGWNLSPSTINPSAKLVSINIGDLVYIFNSIQPVFELTPGAVEGNNGQSLLLTSKSLLNIYNFRTDELTSRIEVPEINYNRLSTINNQGTIQLIYNNSIYSYENGNFIKKFDIQAQIPSSTINSIYFNQRSNSYLIKASENNKSNVYELSISISGVIAFSSSYEDSDEVLFVQVTK